MMTPPTPAVPRPPVGAWCPDRPAKSTVRHLVRIGALPALPSCKSHTTRDVLIALERVADGASWLRERRRAAGLPAGNPSYVDAWAEWCRLHPRRDAARLGAARREYRAQAQAQADLFAGGKK